MTTTDGVSGISQHHLRLVVDYAFSQLRNVELTEEVLRTVSVISTKFPVAVFSTFVQLWSRASTIHVAHKKRLCRAFSECILPQCVAGSLDHQFAEVRQLVSLVLNFSDSQSCDVYDACLQRLAAVDAALFSLVSEQTFARLSVKDVSYAVPLVSLQKIAVSFPEGVKQSHALWFTNVLACLSGGVCTDRGDLMALADLTVAVVEATRTVEGHDQLLTRIFESFYELAHKFAADVPAGVCFLNVLAALAPTVPEVSLHIRREQIAKLFVHFLRLFVTTPKMFDVNSDTLLKFLAGLKRALPNGIFTESINEQLFPLVVRFVASDAKSSPTGTLALACLLPAEEAASVATFVTEKLESRREEDKAAAIWLATEIARRDRAGNPQRGHWCDAALTAFPKSLLIHREAYDFAKIVGVNDISDKLFATIIDRATGDDAAFEVALTFRSSSRMWTALWPRIVDAKSGDLWKICALINVIFDRAVNFVPEDKKAKTVLWLLMHLALTSDGAHKRAIAETYANFVHFLSTEIPDPELSRLLEIAAGRDSSSGADVELEQMFEQLKRQPDALSGLFSAVFGVLERFGDISGQSEAVILQWLSLLRVSIAFAPTDTVAFLTLEKLVTEHAHLLAADDVQVEVAKIYAQLGVRFPSRTQHALVTLWTQAEAMKNQNSFLAIFQPLNAVHAVYMQCVTVAARVLAGTNDHLKLLLDDLTVNALADGSEISPQVISVLSRVIAEHHHAVSAQADKYVIERLTCFFISRLSQYSSSDAFARPCLLALAGLLEIHADRKFTLEISLLSETLSAVLRVLLADSEDVASVAGNFHAAGRLFLALLAVSQSRPDESTEDERIAVAWKCLASLMQTINSVIGNITVLRGACYHLLEVLAAAAPLRLATDAVRRPETIESWGVCVAVVWGGLSGGAEVAAAAVSAVKLLLRRHDAFEDCDFQMGQVSEIGKQFVVALADQAALVAVTREAANQTISGSRMSGNLLLEILNRAEMFDQKYATELATLLFDKNTHGNFLFLRKLLTKNFETVFDCLFLTHPLSHRDDRKTLYVSALHETCRDRKFLLQAVSLTCHALTNTDLAEPRQEALEVLDCLFSDKYDKYVNLEVAWIAQKFLPQLVVACLVHIDKFPELARQCVESVARHNMIEVKLSRARASVCVDWSVEVQRQVRAVIDGRPEVASDLLAHALMFAEPRPEHVLAMLFSLAENSDDLRVVDEAKKWLWNFARVRDGAELTARVNKIA